jgi:hypothetical protein
MVLQWEQEFSEMAILLKLVILGMLHIKLHLDSLLDLPQV